LRAVVYQENITRQTSALHIIVEGELDVSEIMTFYRGILNGKILPIGGGG